MTKRRSVRRMTNPKRKSHVGDQQRDVEVYQKNARLQLLNDLILFQKHDEVILAHARKGMDHVKGINLHVAVLGPQKDVPLLQNKRIRVVRAKLGTRHDHETIERFLRKRKVPKTFGKISPSVRNGILIVLKGETMKN